MIHRTDRGEATKVVLLPVPGVLPLVAVFAGLLVGLVATPSAAGIHTWDVREVFSNADGTVQFVELIDNGVSGGEINVGNGSITTSFGTISWANGQVAPPTNGRSYLIATPAFAALPGAPAPDVIVDPGEVPIFDLNGDTVSFGPYDSLTFGPVPTNGTDSIDEVSGVGPNTPTNYAGVSGSVDASGGGFALDDFQDGTTQGWVASLGFGVPPVPPAAIADAGPMGAGDFALRVTGTGSPFGAGGKLVVNNVDARWTGDYPGSGVAGVVLDVNNPNAFPLRIRLGIAEPQGTSVGGRWVTQAITVPAMSGWVVLEYSLAPEHLLPGDAVAPDVDTTLANVGVLRILHSEMPSYSGDAIAGQLDVDNVEAVPEPGLGLGLVVGSIALARLRGHRRRR